MATFGPFKVPHASANVFECVVTPTSPPTSLEFRLEDPFEVDWGDGVYVQYPGATKISGIPVGVVTIRSIAPIIQLAAIGQWLSAYYYDSATGNYLVAGIRSVEVVSLSGVTNLNRFAAFETLETFVMPSQYWANVTDSGRMFEGTKKLNSVTVSPMPQCVLAKSMFSKSGIVTINGALSFASGADITWMFYDCNRLRCINSVDTASANTGSGVSMMFRLCRSIRQPDWFTDIGQIISGAAYSAAVAVPPCDDFVGTAVCIGDDAQAAPSGTGTEYRSPGGIRTAGPADTPPIITKLRWARSDYEINLTGGWTHVGDYRFEIAIAGGSVGGYVDNSKLITQPWYDPTAPASDPGPHGVQILLHVGTQSYSETENLPGYNTRLPAPPTWTDGAPEMWGAF